jgi:peptidoglycan/LPS O-acetylase OafA/YrhL
MTFKTSPLEISTSPKIDDTHNMIKDYQPTMIWKIIEVDTSQHADHAIFLSSGKRLLQRVAFGLLPSFVQQKIRPGLTKTQRLHATSYLDGLRGVASFVVFMGHYTEENLGWYTEPYGLYEDGARSSPLQLPFVRAIYSARPMVHIFFIISGYVLSYKPLKQIHAQQYSALTTTLSSSVFRRALRLFLPSFVTLFIMAIALYCGFSDSRYAEAHFSLYSQLTHVWNICLRLLCASWAINDIDYPQPPYNPALWTIPVEFAQSLLLFVTILGLSRCITNVRLLLLAGIAAFCFYSGELYTVEFLGGMFIAEITILQDGSWMTPSASPTILPKYTLKEKAKPECGSTIKQKIIQAFWMANVVSGLFIASWTNNHIEEVWGLRFLNAHTPEPYEGQRVWFCLGAFQIVAAFTQLKCLQDIFTTPVAIYLGNISYALYLTHNLCLTILEPRMVPWLNHLFGKTTLWGRHFSWLGGLVLFLPIIISVADLFWRLIDTPSVKFARWLEYNLGYGLDG